MRRLAVVVIASLSVGLAACVTTTPAHNLGADTVRGLRLERVEVNVGPPGQVTWAGLLEETMEAEGKKTGRQITDPQAVVPQAKAEALSRLNAQARKNLEPALRTRLAGNKPVVARVTVHTVYVPTVAGALFGGTAGGSSGMSASIDFVDARTGATVLSYPKTGFMTQGGYKLNMGTSGSISHDPIERMFADMGGQVAAWLAPG
jgi:hypothetical protein